LLGTIFIYTCKTGDAIRCKHQNRHCYTESTCEYYNIIADQRWNKVNYFTKSPIKT